MSCYVRKVTFHSRGIPIVADLYLPGPDAVSRGGAAIIVGHPGTGVKEQTAGLYARLLAEAGFITLAWDAAYQGESGGLPRGLEDPAQRVEDAKSAVSFLCTWQPEEGEENPTPVNPERIGGLGICASGGYVVCASQTDTRIKAVATISGACFGEATRAGISGAPGFELDRAALQAILEQAAQDRISEAKGAEPRMINLLPEELAKSGNIPPILAEYYDYYRSPRGQHPRSTGWQVARSCELLAGYHSFSLVNMISPRPLLMIIGEKANTHYHSRNAIDAAMEPKELFVIPNKTHVGLYDDTSVTLPKLVDFFTTSLTSS
ncbi:Alpha/Beta hydrolase protein [Xylariales sp. PMI_506]|nr:Alpha/Beta hydrolase protein [Xylariales sp. PMI_506]